MLFLVLLFIFFTTFVIVIELHTLLFGKKMSIQRRLKTDPVDVDIPEVEPEQESSLFHAQVEWLNELVNQRIPNSKYLNKIREHLIQADVKLRPVEFVLISIGIAVFVGFIGYFNMGGIASFFLVGVLGFHIPSLMLTTLKKNRAKKLNSQLPQALSIISNGLRAGFSFAQALDVASKELENPIGQEFARVLRDNTLGKPMEEALENLRKRNDDEDVDMLVTVLLIQRQVGGNLSDILDTISGTIRDRVKLRGEIKTLTSQGKFSAVIVGALPIGVAAFIGMANPEYIGVLFTDSLGILLLSGASVMMIVGIYWIAQTVNVKI